MAPNKFDKQEKAGFKNFKRQVFVQTPDSDILIFESKHKPPPVHHSPDPVESPEELPLPTESALVAPSMTQDHF